MLELGTPGRNAAASYPTIAEKAIAIATEVIVNFPEHYRSLPAARSARQARARRSPENDAADTALIDDWLALLHAQHVDFTLGWRRLADAAGGNEAPLRALFADTHAPDAWLARWRARCATDDVSAQQVKETAATERANAMRGVNPLIIARNHRVEEALTAASAHLDLVPFERLLAAVQQPYEELPELERYAEPAPAAVTACYRTFCGT